MKFATKDVTGTQMMERNSQGTIKQDYSTDTDTIKGSCLNRKNPEKVVIAKGQREREVNVKVAKWDRVTSRLNDLREGKKDKLLFKFKQICKNQRPKTLRKGENQNKEYVFLKSDSKIHGHPYPKCVDMSCKLDCYSYDVGKLVREEIKLKDQSITSKSLKHKSKFTNIDNTKHVPGKKGGKVKFTKFAVKDEAASLFEKQLQELEEQSTAKCFRLKYLKHKKKIVKQREPEVTCNSVKSKERENTSSVNETDLIIKNNKSSQSKTEKHYQHDRRNDSNNGIQTDSKKEHSSPSVRNLIHSENCSTDTSKDKVDEQESKHEKLPWADSKDNNTISCNNRCYRLQSAQWKGSRKCVLRLLKRKYRSVRTLFSKKPMIVLDRLLLNKRIKMIGDNFEVISVWEAETDSSVCNEEDGDVDKETNTEGGSLVDPRVMSLSRTLQSGQNGKVGAEKTFKNVSSKHSEAKTKVCFRLQAVKNTSMTRKPLAQKPDWSKLKQKLKEVNEKQILQKKQERFIVGKHVGRIPNFKRNPAITSKDHEKPEIKLGSNIESNINNCDLPESSESIIQERKKELEKLCTGSEPDLDETEIKVDLNEVVSSPRPEEFQEMLSDSEIDLDGDYEIGGYSIEICRDSPDEEQSKEPSVDRDVFDTDDIVVGVTESKVKYEEDTSRRDNEGATLTVTSGIIPNLYMNEGLPASVINDRSRSPPILEREFEYYSETGRVEQIHFAIKDEAICGDETPGEYETIDSKDEVHVCDSTVKVNCDESKNSTVCLEPSSFSNEEIEKDSENVKKNSDMSALQSVHSPGNAQFIHSQKLLVPESNRDNLSLVDHPSSSIALSSPSEILNSALSSITDAALSDSSETLNYSELTDNEVFDNTDQDKQNNEEDVKTEVQTSKSDISMSNVRLWRRLSSSSSSSESDQPALETFNTHAMFTDDESLKQEHESNKDVAAHQESNDKNISGHLTPWTKLENVDVKPKAHSVKTEFGEEAHVKKTSESSDRENNGKTQKKRKRSPEKNCLQENDCDDLPKIPPPKRRHRGFSVTGSSASMEDYTQERLMQELPNHNWLFNKYSSLSPEVKSVAAPKVRTSSASGLRDLQTSIGKEDVLKPKTTENNLKKKEDAGKPTIRQDKRADDSILTKTKSSDESLTDASIPATSKKNISASALRSSSEMSNTKDNSVINDGKQIASHSINSFVVDGESQVGESQVGNDKREMDGLKSSYKGDMIDPQYSKGTLTEQVTNCSAESIKPELTDEEMIQNAPRPLPTYQSFKNQDGVKRTTVKSNSSCDKNSYNDARKTGDFQTSENHTMFSAGQKDTMSEQCGFLQSSKVTLDNNAVKETGYVVDATSVKVDLVVVGEETRRAGNPSYSSQEMVAMATEKDGLDRSRMEEVDHSESSKTNNSCSTMASKQVEGTSILDASVNIPTPLGKSISPDQYAVDQSTVEPSGPSFRQKPNPPVLRVLPHVYKPPGGKSLSPEPVRTSVKHETYPSELMTSTRLTQTYVHTPLNLQTSSGTHHNESFAQTNSSLVLSGASTTAVSHSQSGITSNLHDRPSTDESVDANPVDIVPLPSLLNASSGSRSSSSGMVIPIQPIVQTQGLVNHQETTQVPSSYTSIPSVSSGHHSFTSQALNSGSRRRQPVPVSLIPVTLIPVNPTPSVILSHQQTNPSFLYPQQHTLIKVQGPPINPTQVIEINQINQGNPLHPTNQVLLLENGNSMIPVNTVTTTNAHTPTQHVLTSVQPKQQQQHLGQIISSGQLVFAQPVGNRTADNSVTIVERVSEMNGDNKIIHTSATSAVQSVVAGSGGNDSNSNNYNNDNSNTGMSHTIKKELESPRDENVTLSDDDEEFKRQMEELEREIKRKEREQEEMRKKRLELLEKRKAAKTGSHITPDENQETNVNEKATDIKNNEEKFEKSETPVTSEEAQTSSSNGKLNTINEKVKELESPKEDISNDKSKVSETSDKSVELNAETVESGQELPYESQDTVSKETGDEHDSEDEDSLEGALVIDLSASSKEHGSCSSNTKPRDLSSFKNTVQEGTTKAKSDGLRTKEAETIGVTATNTALSEGQRQECKDNSIEYIEDIGRINPFTGEYDNFEVPEGNNESLDLSSKAKYEKGVSEKNDSRQDKEILHRTYIKTSSNSDTFAEMENGKATDNFSGKGNQEEIENEMEISDTGETETLDLSTKPICVFTFKENNEPDNSQTLIARNSENNEPDNSQTLTARNSENNEPDNSQTLIARNSENNEPDNSQTLTARNSDDDSTKGSEVPEAAEDLRSKAAVVDKDGNSDGQYMHEDSIKQEPENVRSNIQDNSLLIPDAVSAALSVLTRKGQEHNRDVNRERNTEADSRNYGDQDIVMSKQLSGENKEAMLKPENEPAIQVVEASESLLGPNTKTNKSSSLFKELISRRTSDSDRPSAVEQNLDAGSVSVSLSCDGTSQSIHNTTSTTTMMEKTPVISTPSSSNGQLPSARRQYRHRQFPYRPPIHEQRPFLPPRHPGPRMLMAQGQPRFSAHQQESPTPVLTEHPGHMRRRGQQIPTRQQETFRTLEPQRQNLNRMQITECDVSHARNDIQRSRGLRVSSNPPLQKRCRGMFVEIEPAHTRPPPKKIPKGAKPAPAHCQTVNMKEIFRKMNKSYCQVPLAIQQSCPYFKRKSPIFCSPDGTKTKIVDKPKPAHCQKAFSIAGQLIVHERKGVKRKPSREYISPSPTRFFSVPNTPPSPLEETQRSSSAMADLPCLPCEGYFEDKLLSQRSDTDDVISPVRAHNSLENLTVNTSISKLQVLKPPSSYSDEVRNLSQGVVDVIDLTGIESPKMETTTHSSCVSGGQTTTETVVQNELSAALAKRQKLDTLDQQPIQIDPPSSSVPVPNRQRHFGPEVIGQRPNEVSSPRHQNMYHSRMQTPASRAIQQRQLNYSKPPRQVLAPVTIRTPRIPIPHPYPSNPRHLQPPHIQQTKVPAQQVPVPAHLVNRDAGLQGHPPPHVASYQPPPQLVSAQDHHHQAMTYKQNPNIAGINRSPGQSVEMMGYRDPIYETSHAMYPQRTEGLRRQHYNEQKAMPGHTQPSPERVPQQFTLPHHIPQDSGQGHGGPHHPYPQNPQVQQVPQVPRAQMMSPTSPHSPLPPSPREAAQNWSQIQKMQQIRANHIRNRQLQSRQTNREPIPRPGFTNVGQPGTQENFMQGQITGAGYQPSPTQPPMMSPSFKTGNYRSMEPRHPQPLPPPPYHGQHQPLNNQPRPLGSQVTPPSKVMVPIQMVPKEAIPHLAPHTTTQYYHLGPPEVQFISTEAQIPGMHTRPPGHNYNRAPQPPSLQTHPNLQQIPNYNQGFTNPPTFHSTRNSDPVIPLGQDQIPQRPSHKSPTQHSPATAYPIHSGQGQTGEGAPTHMQVQDKGHPIITAPDSKTTQQLEEEAHPHLQQVHGTCILCGKYSLYLCSSCKRIWYCSPECQLTHWQTHVNECKGPAG